MSGPFAPDLISLTYGAIVGGLMGALIGGLVAALLGEHIAKDLLPAIYAKQSTTLALRIEPELIIPHTAAVQILATPPPPIRLTIEPEVAGAPTNTALTARLLDELPTLSTRALARILAVSVSTAHGYMTASRTEDANVEEPARMPAIARPHSTLIESRETPLSAGTNRGTNLTDHPEET